MRGRWSARALAREVVRATKVRARLRRVESRNPILVYQMGKVGSSTVVESIRSLRPKAPVVHVHTLDPVQLERAIANRRGSARPWLPEHLMSSRILVRALAGGTFPCRVVTLVREPVARAISFAFQDMEAKAPEAVGRDPDPATMARAVTRMLRSSPEHADPSLWFDRELRDILNVDVFLQPYDNEAGYSILGGPVPVLVIRVEDLDRSLGRALGHFLGRDPASISATPHNLGATKTYAESLRATKSSYRLPRDLAERMLETRYIRHFYAHEWSVMMDRWMDDGTAGGGP